MGTTKIERNMSFFRSLLSCRIVNSVKPMGYLMPTRPNSNRAGVCKMNRYKYARTYPTVLVQPDGSTITIRYPEPRRIVMLPLDVNTLTEGQRTLRLLRRKPKPKMVIQEEIKDNFDASKYVFLSKKQR